MDMRIAITGAHGVGKSTLASQLSDTLGLPELPTPGRTMAARGLPINEAATVSSQLVACLLQYRLERERSAWVASRSLIDVWAYTVQASGRHGRPGRACPQGGLSDGYDTNGRLQGGQRFPPRLPSRRLA
jgi:hypothetical protein